jgi:hypothetical protein
MSVRKNKELKKLSGTFQRAKEKKPRTEADIKQQIEETKEASESIRVNLRLATKVIAAKGLMVKTVVHDSHGAASKVERINPAIREQKDALKSLKSLRSQLALLESELETVTVTNEEDDELNQFD